MDHVNFVGTCLALLIVRSSLGTVLDTPADAHIVRILRIFSMLCREDDVSDIVVERHPDWCQCMLFLLRRPLIMFIMLAPAVIPHAFLQVLQTSA